MLNLSKLNGISATIIACANCGLSHELIISKLVNKYAMNYYTASQLVAAVIAACGEA